MFNFFKKSKTVSAESAGVTPRGIHHTVSFAVSKDDSFAHIKNELRKMGQASQVSQGQ